MSGFASNQSRSSFRVNNESTGAANGQPPQQQQLYNFPWDFKMKPSPILAQIANNTSSNGNTSSSTAPPPLPTVPPPKTPRISSGGQDESLEQPEDQYCAPWDLKLQEEMLKRMALQKSKSGDDENKKPESSSTTNTISSSSELSTQQKVDSSASSDYNMPWEMKQSILFQSLANGKPPPPTSSQPNMFPTQPLATSSAVSTLTTSNGSGFNKMSQSRLSTRSNASSTSSSSSRRSSTSSVSTNNNSPQQTMNAPPPQPPSLPPPLPPNINTTSPASGSNQTSILSNHTSSSTLMNMSTTVNNSEQLLHQTNCAIMQQQSQNQAAILSPRLSANARLSSNNSVLITACNCSCISTINGGQSVGNKFAPINSTCLSNSSIHNFGGADGHVLGSCGSSGTLNTSSSMTLDNDMSNPFNRQNRAGSSHHFPLSHFQTVATGGKKSIDNSSGNIQVAALPITALIFSQNSLPSNLINIQSQQQQQQQQQMYHQIASNQIVELQKYAWFHGSLTRKQAEALLANRPMGSFLVRQSESGNSNDCSLSLISGNGCVHMRICMKNGEFILGQCSQPFNSIVKMINHYSSIEVPIKGALHVKLTMPVPRM